MHVDRGDELKLQKKKIILESSHFNSSCCSKMFLRKCLCLLSDAGEQQSWLGAQPGVCFSVDALSSFATSHAALGKCKALSSPLFYYQRTVVLHGGNILMAELRLKRILAFKTCSSVDIE